MGGGRDKRRQNKIKAREQKLEVEKIELENEDETVSIAPTSSQKPSNSLASSAESQEFATQTFETGNLFSGILEEVKKMDAKSREYVQLKDFISWFALTSLDTTSSKISFEYVVRPDRIRYLEETFPRFVAPENPLSLNGKKTNVFLCFSKVFDLPFVFYEEVEDAIQTLKTSRKPTTLEDLTTEEKRRFVRDMRALLKREPGKKKKTDNVDDMPQHRKKFALALGKKYDENFPLLIIMIQRAKITEAGMFREKMTREYTAKCASQFYGSETDYEQDANMERGIASNGSTDSTNTPGPSKPVSHLDEKGRPIDPRLLELYDKFHLSSLAPHYL